VEDVGICRSKSKVGERWVPSGIGVEKLEIKLVGGLKLIVG
jgi:hypothetical protein